MEHNFWLNKWQKNDIHFNQNEVNPFLLKYHQHLGALAGHNVFVPLCGKSIDMLWLMKQGASVVGVELSQMAIEQFIHENSLKATQSEQQPFVRYSDDQWLFWVGDYFTLSKKEIGSVEYVYDRASLIAMPKDLRQQYVDHLLNIVDPGTKILLITMQYQAPTDKLPPFSISMEEIEQIFKGAMTIECLESSDAQKLPEHLVKRGFKNVKSRVHLITV